MSLNDLIELSSRTARQAKPAFQPAVERLEARELLTSATSIAAADHVAALTRTNNNTVKALVKLDHLSEKPLAALLKKTGLNLDGLEAGTALAKTVSELAPLDQLPLPTAVKTYLGQANIDQIASAQTSVLAAQFVLNNFAARLISRNNDYHNLLTPANRQNSAFHATALKYVHSAKALKQEIKTLQEKLHQVDVILENIRDILNNLNNAMKNGGGTIVAPHPRTATLSGVTYEIDAVTGSDPFTGYPNMRSVEKASTPTTSSGSLPIQYSEQFPPGHATMNGNVTFNFPQTLTAGQPASLAATAQASWDNAGLGFGRPTSIVISDGNKAADGTQDLGILVNGTPHAQVSWSDSVNPTGTATTLQITITVDGKEDKIITLTATYQAS